MFFRSCMQFGRVVWPELVSPSWSPVRVGWPRTDKVMKRGCFVAVHCDLLMSWRWGCVLARTPWRPRKPAALSIMLGPLCFPGRDCFKIRSIYGDFDRNAGCETRRPDSRIGFAHRHFPVACTGFTNKGATQAEDRILRTASLSELPLRRSGTKFPQSTPGHLTAY
jgi:hypothetical protein